MDLYLYLTCVNIAPAEEAAPADDGGDEAAAEEAPAEEAPAEEAPAEEAPVEEAPAEDAGGDEAAPADESKPSFS